MMSFSTYIETTKKQVLAELEKVPKNERTADNKTWVLLINEYLALDSFGKGVEDCFKKSINN